jgi:ssDNA-binding protein
MSNVQPQEDVQIKLMDVVAVFPKLLKGQEEAFQGRGDPYFSASFIITKDDANYKAMVAGLMKAAEKKWKDKAAAQLKVCAAKDKLALHDGDLKAGKAYGAVYAGKFYVSARNNAVKNQPPTVLDNVLDPKTGKLRVITEQNDPHAPYSGAIVNVVLNAFAYSNEGEGVACSIVGVQFVRHGTRLSGGATLAPDAFQAIPEAAAEQAQPGVSTGGNPDPFA